MRKTGAVSVVIATALLRRVLLRISSGCPRLTAWMPVPEQAVPSPKMVFCERCWPLFRIGWHGDENRTGAAA